MATEPEDIAALHLAAQGIDIIFRETENLKALKHPNIVKILNFYAPTGFEVVFVM